MRQNGQAAAAFRATARLLWINRDSFGCGKQRSDGRAISISLAAVRAERRLWITFTEVKTGHEPLAPKTASLAAAAIVRDAARSRIAQANLERQGTVSLLLK